MATHNRCARNYRATNRPSSSKKSSFGKRMAFDAILTIFIVFEMFIQYTGTFLHEVIGAVFAVSIVAHLIIERKWIKGAVNAFGASKLAGKRKALAVVAVILLLCMVLLMASSVIISTILFSFGLRAMTLNPGGIWYPIHTFSSYALCAATVVHLAMHWSMVASFFKVPYNPARRVAIGRGVGAMAAVGVVAVGVSAARALDVAEALAGAGAENEGVGAAGESDGAAAATGDGASEGEMVASDVPAEAEARDSQPGPDSSENEPASEEPLAPEQEAGGSSTEIEGICTLCKKRCPLSAPLCDKPYIAGLIPMP